MEVVRVLIPFVRSQTTGRQILKHFPNTLRENPLSDSLIEQTLKITLEKLGLQIVSHSIVLPS